ncbi:MAG: geranylgeranylglyceryl/heptaprenylglyceryl phosphate synthase [Methanobrevibacter sp.]|uniref:geranylgeranylglyceryl/heptaprenylglyceryl phosphate synthase n=1 Tax=Methanobrevibacter sp. TaxID=66852 RepID=UPI0025DD5F6D|nr:geranylgeranylglyceryl/heptaprenylglyceryl phosphate synthase [Methanobrevibacter sp.]MBE6508796.1 geranylgeranylglyceryl/heptaprenylglyceryl phosphate synthase [Methanobrevibacter sp.]
MKDVENYIRDILKTRKIHFTLIDPDEQTPEEALEIATQAIEGGTDGIMIGGSTVNGDDVDNTCKILSENIAVPIIIFPGNTSSVSKYADAIFYMSYVNARNPYWINGAQAIAAPAVKASGMEILSMHYMVVEPGGTVGWVGDANLVPRNKPKIPAVYAMSAELFGIKFFYLEAGSGAAEPVPPEMVAYSKKAAPKNILVVGGGIRDGKAAYMAAKAGGDIIVTGTVVEEVDDVQAKIQELTGAILKASME